MIAGRGLTYSRRKMVKLRVDFDALDCRCRALGDHGGRVDWKYVFVIYQMVVEVVASEVQREELPLIRRDRLEEITVERLVAPDARTLAPW